MIANKMPTILQKVTQFFIWVDIIVLDLDLDLDHDLIIIDTPIIGVIPNM